MSKILVLYGTYGSGHKSAANAIKQYIEKNYPEKQVTAVDCIEYINKFLNKMTTGAYNKFTKRAPKIWKKIYFNSENGFLSKVSNRINSLMAKKLYKLIQKENPEIIISTHPFSTQMCGIIKRKYKVNYPVSSVMTDFEIHNQWLQEPEYINKYFVAQQGMKDKMIKIGIDENKIFVTGIPMSERFLEDFNRQEILKEMDLKEKKKTILFFGMSATGPYKKKTFNILEIIAEQFPDCQAIVISGNNKKINKKYNEIVEKNNCSERIKVLEYTKKVPELMSISDIVITKPGGLTSTESLASELPIIIINPIPGQEEQNAEFLEKEEVGIWYKKDRNIQDILNSLLNENEKIQKMKQNIQKFANKHSTRDICENILN